jgi:hypothetical protein
MATCVAASTTPRIEARQLADSQRIVVEVVPYGEHTLEIDDAPGFRTPVWRGVVRSRVELDAFRAGLVPGVDYYLRLREGGPVQRLRLTTGVAEQPAFGCAAQRIRWELMGRPMVEHRSSVLWQSATGRWVANPREQPNGLGIYFAELYLRSALESAAACDDLASYDEIAQYYLLMLDQTLPLAVVERHGNVPATGLMAARTFRAGNEALIGDVELGNVQWLYPAAKLLRLITQLPEGRCSETMRLFTSRFTPFLVDEQFLRFLMRPARPAPGGGADVNRVGLWELALAGRKGAKPWDTAMSDSDLWLLAGSAEVLGANANDSALVHLNDAQIEQLQHTLRSGVRLFQSKRTLHTETIDFAGRQVGSADYFEGDCDGHEEYAYTASTGMEFPAERVAISKLSWDTAHAYRLPVFLRALFENRKATGLEFPGFDDLQLLANQYVYRVFEGDFAHPLFRNFLDGNDGWFRVDTAKNWGYPPSQFCDMRKPNRPCMAPGNLAGWGLLAFVNRDLEKLQRALLSLGTAPTAEAREFRHRYWSFGMNLPNGTTINADMLFLLTADNAALPTAGSRAAMDWNRSLRRH